jgi:hypothetical protein
LSETAVLVVLYIAGFALQIYGVILVVLEIADDVRAARAIRERQDAPSPPAVVRGSPAPGIEVEIGGFAGAHLAQTAYNIDSFRDFTAERLSEGLRRRMVGVGLFVLGAVVGLLANLLAAF